VPFAIDGEVVNIGNTGWTSPPWHKASTAGCDLLAGLEFGWISADKFMDRGYNLFGVCSCDARVRGLGVGGMFFGNWVEG